MTDTVTNSQQQPLHSPGAGTQSPSKEQEQQEYTNLINSLPTRWEIELEFVQSLSNIPYLSYLAQNNYLQDPCFVNYLKYLQYWKEPQYSRYLVYPNCLHILSLLQSEQFRRDIANPEIMNVLMNDMVTRWQENGDGGLEDKGVINREESQNENKGLSAEVVKGNNKRNGSEAVVGTIKEENEDTEQHGEEVDVKDNDVKDEDGDINIK
ncbi:Soh1 RNA polymerase II mediator complex subunit [Candida orthopsilosis Co 90-125]|uniref:Mediator of RNA polymerase II transcription subunit 31 n=1 Tax=Candida orthopsilosis (strain 90-125) TaxID=1136231 RepID=H8X7L8_CANO9|nr:Soh1 RNA polymerase II mediator complex subunit [Candida orthopsilosis Co 90-125]CCG23803.1 Soh1 RNA polymerase II mediator complex subunit [Candida orthopsilosis Co 90-125]